MDVPVICKPANDSQAPSTSARCKKYVLTVRQTAVPDAVPNSLTGSTCYAGSCRGGRSSSIT
jgi:hypothetical protein